MGRSTSQLQSSRTPTLLSKLSLKAKFVSRRPETASRFGRTRSHFIDDLLVVLESWLFYVRGRFMGNRRHSETMKDEILNMLINVIISPMLRCAIQFEHKYT